MNFYYTILSLCQSVQQILSLSLSLSTHDNLITQIKKINNLKNYIQRCYWSMCLFIDMSVHTPKTSNRHALSHSLSLSSLSHSLSPLSLSLHTHTNPTALNPQFVNPTSPVNPWPIYKAIMTTYEGTS